MKRFLLSLSAVVFLVSCSSNTKNTEVTIIVDGLKKGTVYLQKITESGLVNLDSIESNGNEKLNLSLNLEHPELLYAYLDKFDGSSFNDRLAFFAEPGEIQISTTLNNFENAAVVSAGVEHEEFKKLQQMLSRFTKKDFELMQLAQTDRITDERFVDSIVNQSNSNNIKRYQFIANYALTNPNKYVSAYLITSEGEELNPRWKDSIFNSFSDAIKKSKYGQLLNSQLAQQ
jgi:hypothetical protein